MKRFRLPLLLLLLLLSVCENVWLFQKNTEYYHAMNRVRLDPLGLKVYANAPKQKSEQPTVVIFGDSRAQDWPTPDGISKLRFINRGIGAQTSAQALGRYAQDVRPLQPDIVLVQVGVNDLKTVALFPQDRDTIIADCEDNIRQIVAEARQDHARVIVTTIFPARSPSLERRVYWSDEVAPAIREVNTYLLTLQQHDVIILDSATLLSDPQGLLRTDYSIDMLHLNAAGYALLNGELMRLLAPDQVTR